MSSRSNKSPKSRLPRTTILVNALLPKELANIVLGYFSSPTTDLQSILRAGEYETCLSLSIEINDTPQISLEERSRIVEMKMKLGIFDNLFHTRIDYLQEICFQGYDELIKLMISKGVNDWENGLRGACRGGQMYLVQLMISKGASDWNTGLYEACHGGHLEIVQLMISKGADNWDWGLQGALRGKKYELARFMVSKGASEFIGGVYVPGPYGSEELAYSMVSKFAKNLE